MCQAWCRHSWGQQTQAFLIWGDRRLEAAYALLQGVSSLIPGTGHTVIFRGKGGMNLVCRWNCICSWVDLTVKGVGVGLARYLRTKTLDCGTGRPTTPELVCQRCYKDTTNLLDFEDGIGPRGNDCGQLLEAREDQEMDSPWGPQKAAPSCLPSWF